MTEKELRKLRRQDLLELLLEQGKEAVKLADQLTETENSLAQVNSGYERLKRKLDEKDVQIEKLKYRLDEKDLQINKLKKRLDEKDAKISRLRGEVPVAEKIPEEEQPVGEEQLTERMLEKQSIGEQLDEHLAEKPLKEQITGKQEKDHIEKKGQSEKKQNNEEESPYEDDFDLKDDFDNIEWLMTEPENTDEREAEKVPEKKRKKFWKKKKSRRKAE